MFRFGALTVFLLAVASITRDAGPERALVAYGDANRVETFSGIPYFFLQAGRRIGLFKAGVTLRPGRFRHRRMLWNALRPLTLNRPCGFMYSRAHLHALWADRRAPSGIGEYVSHIQSLPPRELVDEPVSYYIDATMSQYFDDYERSLGRRIRAEALAREKEAYEAARFVVCMSRWCAGDVKASHGIAPEKVRVILPGANIDDSSVPAPAEWDGTLVPLRLGFIGIGWERKGGAGPLGRGNEAAADGTLRRGRGDRAGRVRASEASCPAPLWGSSTRRATSHASWRSSLRCTSGAFSRTPKLSVSRSNACG